MVGYRSHPFLLFFLLILPMLHAQTGGEVDWKYEIELLGKELSQKHVDLFASRDSTLFFNELDHIADIASELSLFQVSVRLQQAVARLGDSQTRINYHFNIDANSILPLECYWFSDGLYITRVRSEYSGALGKRIVSVNGFPLERVVDSLSTLIGDNNPSHLKSEVPRLITWTQLLAYFGFSEKEKLELGLEDPSGQPSRVLIRLPARESDLVSVPAAGLPLGWQDQKSFFRDRYFNNDKIYYIQYNKCWSREAEEQLGSGASALFMPSFEEFEKRVFRTIRKNPIDKLVLDLRFNGGGSSEQGTRFIEALTKTQFKGQGRFYLLVSRHTFSSAIVNAMDLVKQAEVVIVGEPTGGMVNHFGEVKRFVLPESNLVVSYPTRYFELSIEGSVPIIPHIEAPISFSKYLTGIDPAMEKVKIHIPGI